jgi:hypothetical protein
MVRSAGIARISFLVPLVVSQVKYVFSQKNARGEREHQQYVPGIADDPSEEIQNFGQHRDLLEVALPATRGGK